MSPWQSSVGYVRGGLVLHTLHTNLYLNMKRSLYIVRAVSPMEGLLTDSGWIARLDGNMHAGSLSLLDEL